MTHQDNSPPSDGFWKRPVTRGALNAVVFFVLLMFMQVQGVFQPARPITQDTATQNLLAGVIFGFVIYLIELWKQNRRKAADARRNAAAADDDDDDSDDRRD